MDKLEYIKLRELTLDKLCDLLVECENNKLGIQDTYLRAARLSEDYKLYSDNEKLIRVAIALKTGISK